MHDFVICFQPQHGAVAMVSTPVNLAEAEESISILSSCLKASQRELEVIFLFEQTNFYIIYYDLIIVSPWAF